MRKERARITAAAPRTRQKSQKNETSRTRSILTKTKRARGTTNTTTLTVAEVSRTKEQSVEVITTAAEVVTDRATLTAAEEVVTNAMTTVKADRTTAKALGPPSEATEDEAITKAEEAVPAAVDAVATPIEVITTNKASHNQITTTETNTGVSSTARTMDRAETALPAENRKQITRSTLEAEEAAQADQQVAVAVTKTSRPTAIKIRVVTQTWTRKPNTSKETTQVEAEEAGVPARTTTALASTR